MLFGRKPKEELVLVLDIESSNVGAGLVVFKADNMPKVLYSTRVPISLGEELSVKKLLPTILKFLDEALHRVATDGIKHLNFRALKDRSVDKVFCVLSTPWYISRTSTVKREGENIRISQKLIDDIVAEEVAGLEKRLPAEYSKEALGSEVRLLEKQITEITINGYETSDPFGKSGNEVTVSMFVSVMPKHVTEEIERIVGRYIHTKDIGFHSSTMSVWNIVRDIFVDPENFIMFDIGKERVNVSLIKNSKIVDSGSITYGENDVVRFVAKRLRVQPSVALSYLSMYSEDNLDSASRETMKTVIGEAETEWTGEVNAVLQSFLEKDGGLPRRVFLSSSYESMDLFSVWVREALNSRGIKSIITPVSNDIVEHFLRSESLVDHGICMQSIYYNKLFHAE